MIKKKDLSEKDIETWESYIKNPSDVYDKDINNKKNLERKDRFRFDLHGHTLDEANQKVRDIREGRASNDGLVNVWQELQKYTNDWLCAVEILEISSDDSLNTEIKTHLINTEVDEVTKGLINDSLSLIEIE